MCSRLLFQWLRHALACCQPTRSRIRWGHLEGTTSGSRIDREITNIQGYFLGLAERKLRDYGKHWSFLRAQGARVFSPLPVGVHIVPSCRISTFFTAHIPFPSSTLPRVRDGSWVNEPHPLWAWLWVATGVCHLGCGTLGSLCWGVLNTGQRSAFKGPPTDSLLHIE